jgi:hypothetical protein
MPDSGRSGKNASPVSDLRSWPVKKPALRPNQTAAASSAASTRASRKGTLRMRTPVAS